ncbi:MAG: CHAD domain-containing protein [Bryobacteraceae bacterium]|nr:CHAD domain-containing protein [Bryobacteraceae bacterium]
MKRERALEWDLTKSPADNAREALPRLAEQFFGAGRKALKKRKPKSLHRFRIRTKSFRYALEIFQPLYGPAFESRLESLKQIQQYLGDISDCASTRRLLKGPLAANGFVTEELNRSIDATERQRMRKLSSYWRNTFDAAGEEERWVRYLRDYAGRAKAPGG